MASALQQSILGPTEIPDNVAVRYIPQFQQALTQAAASHPRLIVDVTALAYLDSAGIAALFSTARHTELELILGPGCLVASVIEISRLDHVATISLRQ